MVTIAPARRSSFGPIVCKSVSTDDGQSHPQQEITDGAAQDNEAALYRGFIAAVNAATSAADVSAIIAAYEAQDTDGMRRAAGLDDFDGMLGDLNDAIEECFSQAGSAMTQAVANGTADAGPFKLAIRFDRLNPAAAEAARTLSQGATSALSADTLAAVQAAVERAVTSGRGPNSAVTSIKQSIGLTEQQAQALENYRNALEAGNSGQAAGYSISQADQNTIKNLPKGSRLPQEKIDQLVENYRQRSLKQRATTIARTETMGAANAGASQAWQQMIEASGYPPEDFRRFWIATNDGRTRPFHRAIPGMNASGVTVNQPYRYPGGTIMRPHDPSAPPGMRINCRCCEAVRYVPPTMVSPLPIFGGTSVLP